MTGKIDTHAYIARNCSGTPTSGPYSYAFLSCQATVGADYEDWVRVTDLTNGTLYTPAVPTGYYGILDFSGVEMGTTCYNGCSSYSYNLGANNSTRTSARASFDINLPNVNTSHAFQIELGVEGFILEIVDTAHFGFGHVKRLRGEVSGSVDLSAPRFGSTLVRVTVT